MHINRSQGRQGYFSKGIIIHANQRNLAGHRNPAQEQRLCRTDAQIVVRTEERIRQLVHLIQCTVNRPRNIRVIRSGCQQQVLRIIRQTEPPQCAAEAVIPFSECRGIHRITDKTHFAAAAGIQMLHRLIGRLCVVLNIGAHTQAMIACSHRYDRQPARYDISRQRFFHVTEDQNTADLAFRQPPTQCLRIAIPVFVIKNHHLIAVLIRHPQKQLLERHIEVGILQMCAGRDQPQLLGRCAVTFMRIIPQLCRNAANPCARIMIDVWHIPQCQRYGIDGNPCPLRDLFECNLCYDAFPICLKK